MSLVKRVTGLRQRKSLAIGEAAYIVQESHGGTWDDAVALLTEAIQNDELGTETKLKQVDTLRTTVAMDDLTAWLNSLAPITFALSGERSIGSVGDNLAEDETRAPPKPVSQGEITKAFPIKWGDKLKKAPSGDYKWLNGTWVRKGSRKPGDPATYNPAAIAVALVVNKKMSLAACDAAIKRNFPEWCNKWEEMSEYLKN
jgi:hypothetical protein